MARRSRPALIGAFVVGALALLALTVIALAGDRLFVRSERAVMHFTGSVYGLQTGAPVVFRGVRVGSVSALEVVYDSHPDTHSIRVRADLDAQAVRALQGAADDAGVPLGLERLVQRGLTAQLQMQSFVTGLLYIDLDLRPGRSAGLKDPRSRGAGAGAAVEIPTTATAIQALKSQLDGMDFRRLAEDVSAIAASARAVLAGPQLQAALEDLAQVAANVNRLTARLDRRLDPLSEELQRTLQSARQALHSGGEASRSVAQTSDRLGLLLAPEGPLVQDLRTALSEVARSAEALRATAESGAPLAEDADRALRDVSAAARALRMLVETLDRQPDAWLRGRRTQP